MNVERLLAVKTAVLSHPERFNMGSWHYETFCGTTHCIGGWAQVLFSVPTRTYDEEYVERTRQPRYKDAAADLLELSREQEYRLFYLSAWPMEFLPPTAENAARRIDKFIETGGAV